MTEHCQLSIGRQASTDGHEGCQERDYGEDDDRNCRQHALRDPPPTPPADLDAGFHIKGGVDLIPGPNPSVDVADDRLGGRLGHPPSIGRECRKTAGHPANGPRRIRDPVQWGHQETLGRGGDVHPGAERITVVVVDDDDVFRGMVVALLAREPDIVVVGQAADGRAAVTLAEELVPDVVVLDLSMPTSSGGDGDGGSRGGIEAAGTISTQLPTTKVVMLSASEQEADVFEALLAGASGYVLKEDLLGHLAGVVRTMADDLGVLLSPSIAIKVLNQTRMAPSTSAGRSLSKREGEVLTLVGQGKTNDQIAEELFLSTHTVKRHVANILSKLHQRSREDAVTHAVREGFLDGLGTPPAHTTGNRSST
jgi:DNA-binding NarL/FixJ family response regulator